MSADTQREFAIGLVMRRLNHLFPNAALTEYICNDLDTFQFWRSTSFVWSLQRYLSSASVRLEEVHAKQMAATAFE